MSDAPTTPAAPQTPAARRRVFPMVLIVVSSLLVFLGIFSVWINRQMLNTDNWTETSSEMLDNATIRNQIAAYLVDELYANNDVQGTIEAALPPRAKPLAGPAAGAVRNVAETATQKLLQRPRVQAAWEAANRRAHQRFLFVLNGGGDVLSTQEGTVTLDLKELLGATAGRVGIGDRVAGKLPAGAAQITIMKSDQLDAAQRALRTLRRLPIVLVGLALLLFALAVRLATGWRREAVRAWGTGLLLAGIAAFVVKSLAGDAIVNALASTDSAKPAVRAVWDIATDLLDEAATATIFYGLIAVVGAWLAGPTGWATSVRAGWAPYLREPRWAWGGFAAFVLLIVWWGPTPATRNPITGTLLFAILAFGLQALRRQTAREFPDASLEEASARLRARFSGLFGRGRDLVSGSGRAQPEEQQRLEALERLGRLHDEGVLDDGEFRREKARLFDGAATSP